ncbi:MAG: DUF4124 domain-containing protein [Burkholderiales bacterium]|jgi:hypothetical protein|nr:DUF4124 domain-containing protein [Burkholderiales bacterium]
MKIETTLIAASVGVALLLVVNGAAAQRLYRCTGNDGRVVYSDQKCAPNEQRQVVKIIDNSMDSSGLRNSAATSSGLDGSMSAQGGGSVGVIGNSSPSSSAPSSRPTRRRCGR